MSELLKALTRDCVVKRFLVAFTPPLILHEGLSIGHADIQF